MTPEGLRVLMITSEWPTPDKPYQVPFIVRQVNFLRAAGVQLRLFHFRGGKRPSNYARAWRQARAELSNGQFDLIHAQWGQSGLLALPRRVPLVVTFRGDDLEGIIGSSGQATMQGWALQHLSRRIASLADQVIVVSKSLAARLPKRPYHVIPSGIDFSLFCPASQSKARERLGLSPNRRYILFAGSAGNPRKRYGLAQQVAALASDGMDVELLTASNIPYEQMPDYMNASDVLLLTSLHEGSPNVVKEALACNLPVVSTDVGDVRERTGAIPGCIVLEDDRPTSIARALREVLLRGERINGREAVADLDERILTQKVLDVYRLAVRRK